MSFSFNTSSLFKISLVSLALLGAEQKGYASCAEDDEDNSGILASSSAVLSSECSATAIVEVEEKDSGTIFALKTLPSEIIDNILSRLDPSSLTAAMQTCRRFEGIVKNPSFQKNYMVAQLPTIFGDSHGKVMGEFFQGESPYLYNKLLRDLLSKDNVAHLKKNNMAIIEQLFPLQEGAIPLESLNLVKHLAMASQANKLFTENMNVFERERIIKALAPLSAGQIKAFAEAIAQQAEKLFTAGMSGFARALIMAALAPLSAEQIKVIAQQADKLFTENMNVFERERIIKALASLSAKKIKAFAEAIAQQADKLFTVNMVGLDRALIMAALAPLSAGKIKAFAEAIAQQAEKLFTANMSGYDRALIMAALAPLSAEKIEAFAEAVAQQAGNLFTANMVGLDLALIMTELAPLSAKQIKGVSAFFEPGDNSWRRLDKIDDYVQVNNN